MGIDADAGVPLEDLSRMMQLSFEASSADRRRIHAWEWDNGVDLPALLGDEEVKATLLAGVISRLSAGRAIDESLVEQVMSKAGLGGTAIERYFPGGLNAVPQFGCYLACLEAVRFGVLAEIGRG